MSTTFWDLYSDIILEICRYFTVDELFYSFYPDVLPYLFEILTESHINLHLCLTNDSLLTGMLLSLINIDQVVYLHVSSDNIPLNEFNAVKTLTLNDVPNMNSIISKPFLLPSLQRLILIYSDHLSHQAENALRSAFARPSLKYLKLHLSNGDLLLPNNLFGQSFSIEQLVINTSCSKSILSFLFHSLPCLRILQIRTLMNSEFLMGTNQFGGGNAVAPLPPVINHRSLQILDLVWYHPIMVDITVLLTGLPNLKRCRLSGVMNSKELNGKIWHKLITETCSNLIRINLNMLIWTGIETEEIKTNFDQDMFFKHIDFELIPSDNEKELLILIGAFKRSIQ